MMESYELAYQEEPMMNRSSNLTWLPCALLATMAACGGGGLDPGSQAGTGTATLLINADVVATPLVPNASKATDFNTSFSVEIRKGGQDVIADSVVVVSDAGMVTLLPDNQGNQRWRGAQSGYYEIYRLTIEAGADNVRDVQVDGPALHYFSAPLPGATVDATMPLVVTWKRSEPATVITVDTRQLDSVAISDTGTYTIPVGGLKSKPDQTEQERVRIDRAERITPLGAVVGSDVRVMVHNEIELVVAPTGQL